VKLRIVSASDTRAIARLLAPARDGDRALDRGVRAIVDAVRKGGDRALTRFARQFDGLSAPVEVSPEEMREGAARVSPAIRRALSRAARNIALVAFRQIPRHVDFEVSPGVSIEQRVEPLARVGCYVPGGRF
jgi:histidinol dehydrogenase